MDEIENLEEPPPITRTILPVKPRPKRGLLAGWSGRPSSKKRRSESSPPPVSVSSASRRGSYVGIILLLAAVSVVGAQGWMLYKTRTELAHVNVKLDEARSSLGLLWQSTKRMDEDQVARLALLADSIRWVLGYAQGEVRLWEATYTTLQQRLDDGGRTSTKALKALNTRIDGFARATLAARNRIDALERQDYMHSSAVEALVRRTQNQEANTHDVVSTVSALRETLGRADSELSQLEQRLAASSSAYGQLGRRVDNLAGFADGFRRAGLNGAEVSGQLSQLADELRRIRIRVDSMRPMTRTVMSSDSR